MVVNTTRRSRALASAIREVRRRSGMRGRQLAEQLGLSHTTLSHWENGRRIPDVEDVASLLGAVGVNGDERERILNLARHASEPNWLTVGMPGLPDQLAGAVDCEADAATITEWSPLLIPGLLQTVPYSRELLNAATGLSANEVETRMYVRAGRRETFMARKQETKFHAIVDEAALRTQTESAEVMLGQLEHLRQATQNPIVTLQVVASNAGWHPGLHGPFVFYEFPDSEPVVHFEHYSSGAFVEEEMDIAAYRYVIERLVQQALSPDDSLKLISQLIKEMEKV